MVAFAKPTDAPGLIDVRQLGIIPNLGADQTAAIQGAIARHNCFFPAGEYLTDPLYQPSFREIAGAGMHLTRIKLNANSIPADNPYTYHSVITNQYVLSSRWQGTPGTASNPQDQGLVVRDLWLDGNRDNQTSTYSESECLSFYGVKNARVERVRMTDSVADGFDLDYCDNVHAFDLEIDNTAKSGVHFSRGGPQGVQAANNNCSVTRALIMNSDSSALTDSGIGAGRGQQNIFKDIEAYNCNNESSFYGAISLTGDHALLDGAIIRGTLKGGSGDLAGLHVSGDYNVCRRVIIDEVAGGGEFDGWGLLVEGEYNDISIDQIQRIKGNGVRLRNSGANNNRIWLASMRDITSDAVSVRDGATLNVIGGQLDSGVTGHGAYVRNNSPSNTFRNFTVLSAGASSYGVKLQAGSNNNRVVSCDFGALPTGNDIDDGATGTVTANNIAAAG